MSSQTSLVMPGLTTPLAWNLGRSKGRVDDGACEDFDSEIVDVGDNTCRIMVRGRSDTQEFNLTILLRLVKSMSADEAMEKIHEHEMANELPPQMLILADPVCDDDTETDVVDVVEVVVEEATHGRTGLNPTMCTTMGWRMMLRFDSLDCPAFWFQIEILY